VEPLDLAFNAAVVSIARRLFPYGFDVSDQAPRTFDELKALFDADKRLVVYSGGSSSTIYADPGVNYAFRAWHDWSHWVGHHDLTFPGEVAVCKRQQADLVELYGDNEQTRRWCKLIHAEIAGQATYHLYHKRFPDNQRAFVEAFLENPEQALSWSLW
jgi:hypothetical protein